MEKWQKQHITVNLPDLISNTRVNDLFLSFFKSQNILSKENVEEIMERGMSQRAYILYDIIQTRLGGYACLLEALNQTKQSGALTILLDTAPNLFSQNLVVVIGTKELSLAEHLSKQKLQEFTCWVEKQLNAAIYKTLACSRIFLSPVTANVPEPDPLYIPRYLSRRTKIDSKIFEVAKEDIFVFKNISRLKLREFAGKNVIMTAKEQLFEINCRFILLDSDRGDAHWNELKMSAVAPIHLVAFHDAGNTFVLQQTSGGFEILSQFLEHETNQIGILETELISIERPEIEKGLCICDSPGMGKTMLLANLARKTQAKYSDRIVAFIRLSQFAQNLIQKHVDSINFEMVQDFLLEWLTNSPLTKYLLRLLLEANLVKMELFFDGLDEVQYDHLDAITKFLAILLDKMPNCRVYTTSRTHVRQVLESATRFIAFDILPFDEEHQIQYLVSFWQKNSEDEKTKLSNFARKCLKIFQRSVNDNEKKLLGIPLQCRIFAEIYSKSARFYDSLGEDLDQSIVRNVYEMYKVFMEQRLPKSRCNFQCILKPYPPCKRSLGTRCSEGCRVKSFHTWTALQIVLPHFASLITQKTSEFLDISVPEFLGPGVLVKVTTEGAEVHFLHRSFAEYLCADFFSSQLLVSTKNENGNLELAEMAIAFLFTDLMQTTGNVDLKCLRNVFDRFDPRDCVVKKFEMKIEFRHPLVVYFAENFAKSLDVLNTAPSFIFNSLLGNGSITCFEITCAVLKADYVKLLQVFLRVWLTPDKRADGIVPLFQLTNEHKVILMNTAARYSSPSTINILIDLFEELAHIDLMLACESAEVSEWSPIQIVVRFADYRKVSMFYEKLKPEGRALIYFLVQWTYGEDKEVLEKRKDICNLLLDKYPFLLTETHEDSERKRSGPVVAPIISLELIMYLVVEKGADIRATNNKYKQNVVANAARYMNGPDFENLIKFVIHSKNATDLFIPTEKWESPLPYTFGSAMRLNLDTVQMIFDHTGADVNEVGLLGQNLVQKAIKVHQCMDIIKFLVNTGANLTHRDDDGLTSLHIAVEYKNYEAFEYITSLNIIGIEERDKDGMTPILVAAKRGNLEMIEHLHKLGANLFAMDNGENSILLQFSNCANRRFEFQSFLIWLQRKCEATCPIQQAFNDSGELIINDHCLCNFFGMPNRRGETPIMFALLGPPLLPESLKIFLDYSKSRKGKFLKHPVDLNTADQAGRTALHRCLMNSKCPVSVVKTFIENGLEWNVKDKYQCNITHHCVREGRDELLKYFVGLGSDVNELDVNGNNALQCYFRFENLLNYYYYLNEETLVVLVESGLNSDNINKNGETASIMYKMSPHYTNCDEQYLKFKDYF